MMEIQIADRIVVARNVTHGKPRIAGTRVMVYQVLDLLAVGKGVAEITSDDYFPDLTEADVYACVAYASNIVRDDFIIPTTPSS
ncbi:MAG: DUF433 domain-containing protein [Chloroflexota bacterium]